MFHVYTINVFMNRNISLTSFNIEYIYFVVMGLLTIFYLWTQVRGTFVTISLIYEIFFFLNVCARCEIYLGNVLNKAWTPDSIINVGRFTFREW